MNIIRIILSTRGKLEDLEYVTHGFARTKDFGNL